MSSAEEKANSDDWSAGTHEGLRQIQLRDGLRTTPAERLAWLEEALKLAQQAQANHNHSR